MQGCRLKTRLRTAEDRAQIARRPSEPCCGIVGSPRIPKALNRGCGVIEDQVASTQKHPGSLGMAPRAKARLDL
jgi:hypothetical protein